MNIIIKHIENVACIDCESTRDGPSDLELVTYVSSIKNLPQGL
jgi:hypothetical protein